MSGAYYNEIDPYAAQWLRNLIAAGHIAPGDVDTRSILEVKPDDLKAYTQCHFFAGIGGWSLALRLAGVDDSRPVWTGSCPCQPFSTAGRQRGSADERHLWPAFFYLISECRPGRVFGEQVAGAAGLAWLDHVCADLEGAGYAAAAANLCAAGAGAPHIRQRLYWVAHAGGGSFWGRGEHPENAGAAGEVCGEVRQQRIRPDAGADSCGDAGGLANDDSAGRHRLGSTRLHERRSPTGGAAAAEGGADRALGDDADRCGQDSPLADPERNDGRAVEPQRGSQGRTADGRLNPWADLEWLPCSDGKARPTQPGLFPLAHGIPNRVGRLRAYGNAIVPAVGAAFIKAVM